MTVLTIGAQDRLVLEMEQDSALSGAKLLRAASLDSACIQLVREDIDVVLAIPHGSPREVLELLAVMQRRRLRVPVVVYWPEGSQADAARLLQAGAQDCIVEPLSASDLVTLLEASTETRKPPVTSMPTDPSRKLLIGESPVMNAVRDLIRLVGQRKSTVLITGETGTGKELAARSIHMLSDRRNRDMVSVNCAALPDSLLEAELFGHTRGAFTGAVAQRAGRFEIAHQSTIFLDEIAEMPIETQAKLLRVLQEKEIQRVGSCDNIGVDVRVIAATNIDLRQAARERRFREDLLYRLRVVELKMPALRQRIGDVPVLVDHFIEKVCRREGLAAKCVGRSALDRLSAYSWPGNVRELENVVESAVVLSGDRVILDADDFDSMEPLHSDSMGAPVPVDLPVGGVDLEQFIASIESALLSQALRRAEGNKARAADMLGIPRTTLISKVKSLRRAC